jgi:hypothetical protein
MDRYFYVILIQKLERDGYPADPENIFLTAGFVEHLLIEMFVY